MIFFFPALVSGSLIVFLGRSGDLFAWQEALFAVWFFVALLVQLFAPSTNLWLIGLLAQVALAIVLVMKDRMGRIL
jgi:hypothetical protein